MVARVGFATKVQQVLQLKMSVWKFKMADMEKIHLFMYEKCIFPCHNEYLEFDGSGKYSRKR